MNSALKVLVLAPLFTTAVVVVLICGLFFELCHSFASDDVMP